MTTTIAHRRRIAALAAAALITGCSTGNGGIPASTEPSGTELPPTSSTTEALSGPQDVSIATSDGVQLAATHWPGSNRSWVVLAHMEDSDRTAWNPLAEALHDAGYSVLTYDNRGHGGSAGTVEPYRLQIDASAAISHAYANGAIRIAFGGASMNGATAMVISPFYDFPAVFVLSGIKTFGRVANGDVAVVDAESPMLFMAADGDGRAADDALAFSRAAPGGFVEILEGDARGTDLLTDTPAAIPLIVDWLERVLTVG